METFQNSSSSSSIVPDEVNDGIIHNCYITNEIFLPSRCPVFCTICHRNPFIDNNINSVSSMNVLINEQEERLKALNKYKVDDKKNTLNFEQNQIYLTTLQRRIDMISEWIIHFIDETVLSSSFNDELKGNAEMYVDQLMKIEELLQSCHSEYENIVYYVNDINVQIQLDLSILLINCLQVYINQLTQKIKYECEEILIYIKTNVKCLIEQMKMMLSVDVDDIMCIQYPCHQINQRRCTSLNNIQEIQFKLLYMTCIHNHLVNLCKIVNWSSINAHSDTTVLLRQFCCSYTYLNRINQYLEYYNNTYQDETTVSIKLGSSSTLSALNSLQEGSRQKNSIEDIIPENDIKPMSPSLFQAEFDYSSITTVRSFNKEIQSNVPDQIDLDKSYLKEKHNVISRKSSDLLITEPSSSTSPSLSSSALLLMDSKNKQLVSKSYTAKSTDYSVDNDDITSKIVIDNNKRSPIKHNPVHKLCSNPSTIVTKTFQSNSDVYDLLSQVKLSLIKVERHLNELDAYHDDGDDDDDKSVHSVNQVGESLSLPHLATSCDQLIKFLGQLKAYDFRINSTKSLLKSTVPSSSTSLVVTTDQDELLNELNIVWRKLIVGTKKWISKLQYYSSNS
ncbi:unnamed protein product [Schistosoma guineensis]|nr:unnamed protein product [Schistosoma guineensis]